MGPEQSKEEQVKIITVKSPKSNESPVIDEIDIPLVETLIKRTVLKESFPEDLMLSPNKLPKYYQMIRQYFYSISFHLNKNEETLALQMKKQFDEYSQLPVFFDKRRNDLNGKLANVLSSLRSLDDDIKTTTESINAAISRAEALAQLIDPSIPRFVDFKP